MLRDLYIKICKKIYAAGKDAYTKNKIEQIYSKLIHGDSTRFYENASVLNLQNNPDAIKLGENCHIYGSLTVFPFVGKIIFGSNCSLGDNSRIVSANSITIGDRVMIAHNVNIIDNNSHPIDYKERHEDFLSAYTIGMQKFDLNEKPIIIEDDVWIGFNSVILKGVKIGRGAIIGAGSLVTKDIEAWTINAGNPLRCIRKINPESYIDDTKN
jgi:acetyltransferase-like isoleucine patch superfamily enzyme